MRFAIPIVALCALSVVSPLRGPDNADLANWRKPDPKGQSCSNCHSPDGIELRAFGFSRKDILRRASAHQPTAIDRQIADFILNSHPGWSPIDAMAVRPLQPGGYALPGATAAERDGAFGRELSKRLPGLFSDISDKASALRVRDQLLNLDPRTLPVGIQFDRLSEDEYHGKEHSTLADWLPDVPVPIDANMQRLEDDYLKSPGLATLGALDAACSRILPKSPAEQLAIGKYRSLLLLQHALRVYGPGGARLDRIALLGGSNPFWEVADVARRAGESGGDIGLPTTIEAKKRGVPFQEQMKQLRLPWFWLAWCLDPGLQNSGSFRQIERGDYFTKALWSDGPYPFHMAFMLTKKLVERGCRPSPKIAPALRHFEIQYSNLVDDAPLTTREPADPQVNELFRRFVLNSFRLSLYLLEDDLQRTGACIRPEAQANQIAKLRAYMSARGEPSDLVLCDRVAAELKSARVDAR